MRHYSLFTSYDDKLIDETGQWSSGYATCAKIGIAGDLAGFRDCVKDAWDGFEGAVFVAHDEAKDLLDDTGQECNSSLHTYMRATETLWARNKLAHEAADSLDFDAMKATFRGLPKAARKYSAASIAARDACSPT